MRVEGEGGVGGGFQHSQTLCDILVAIVFGLENPTFLAQSHIFIPKFTEGREGGEVPTV